MKISLSSLDYRFVLKRIFYSVVRVNLTIAHPNFIHNLFIVIKIDSPFYQEFGSILRRYSSDTSIASIL